MNSVRIYELLGCEYYLPYWDLPLTNLWYSLPNEWRYQRNIFRMYLNQVYRGKYKELLSIPIALNRTLLPTYIQITWQIKLRGYLQYMKFKLGKTNVGKYIKRIFRKSATKNDNMDYLNYANELVPLMQKSRKKLFHFHNKWNNDWQNVFGHWCTEKMKEEKNEKNNTK